MVKISLTRGLEKVRHISRRILSISTGCRSLSLMEVDSNFTFPLICILYSRIPHHQKPLLENCASFSNNFSQPNFMPVLLFPVKLCYESFNTKSKKKSRPSWIFMKFGTDMDSTKKFPLPKFG